METKTCKRCEKSKDLFEFGKDRKKKDGLCQYCKICASEIVKQWRIKNNEYAKELDKLNRIRNRPKRLEANKKHYENNKILESNRMLKYRYKVTDEQLEQMRSMKLCPICGNKAIHEAIRRGCIKGKIVVDHDHKTQQVRGFICTDCNTAIGHANENINVLENMITYLKNYQQVTA